MPKTAGRRKRVKRGVHKLEARSLEVSRPEIGIWVKTRPKTRVHHLSLPGQPKLGQPAAFSPSRECELQKFLEKWLRAQPKRPKLDSAAWFVMQKLRGPEKDLAPSTIKRRIVRPTYQRVFSHKE